MDRGFKTALIAAATAALLVASALGAAQEADSRSAGADAHARGTRELPRGLTIVPWKKDESVDDKTDDADEQSAQEEQGKPRADAGKADRAD